MVDEGFDECFEFEHAVPDDGCVGSLPYGGVESNDELGTGCDCFLRLKEDIPGLCELAFDLLLAMEAYFGISQKYWPTSCEATVIEQNRG